MIDRLEKAGRFALWVALTIVVVLYPVQTFLREQEAARLANIAKTETARLKVEVETAEKAERAAKAKGPPRITLDSMGPFFTGREGSLGYAWFTNASARAGVICVYANLTNSAGKGTQSLPLCKGVDAYDSNVKLTMMFAGADVSALCQSGCDMHVKDMPVPTSLQ